MQSKEEIEKALNNLWNSLDDELFNLIYSQEEMQEDLRTILNEYKRKEQQIKQLKIKGQKLIEKLENEINQITSRKTYDYAGSEWQESWVVEELQEILKILKGENDE